jgi:hypothetical protein
MSRELLVFEPMSFYRVPKGRTRPEFLVLLICMQFLQDTVLSSFETITRRQVHVWRQQHPAQWGPTFAAPGSVQAQTVTSDAASTTGD